MSATEAHGALLRWLRRGRAARHGGVAVEFALVFPVLVVITVGLMELALVFYHYHRAAEATRAAARSLLITPAVTGFGALPLSCPGDPECDPEVMAALVGSLQTLLPGVTAENIRVVYEDSGLPVNASPAMVITPTVTVEVTGIRHPLSVLAALVPGTPGFIMLPSFATTQLGPSEAVPAAP